MIVNNYIVLFFVLFCVLTAAIFYKCIQFYKSLKNYNDGLFIKTSRLKNLRLVLQLMMPFKNIMPRALKFTVKPTALFL